MERMSDEMKAVLYAKRMEYWKKCTEARKKKSQILAVQKPVTDKKIRVVKRLASDALDLLERPQTT